MLPFFFYSIIFFGCQKKDMNRELQSNAANKSQMSLLLVPYSVDQVDSPVNDDVHVKLSKQNHDNVNVDLEVNMKLEHLYMQKEM